MGFRATWLGFCFANCLCSTILLTPWTRKASDVDRCLLANGTVIGYWRVDR